ncbi:hypothetical protein GCM10029978_049200 [Actinoallomurus acanthiterrae]
MTAASLTRRSERPLPPEGGIAWTGGGLGNRPPYLLDSYAMPSYTIIRGDRFNIGPILLQCQSGGLMRGAGPSRTLPRADGRLAPE